MENMKILKNFVKSQKADFLAERFWSERTSIIRVDDIPDEMDVDESCQSLSYFAYRMGKRDPFWHENKEEVEKYCFSGDQQELAKRIEKLGYDITLSGRSGFAARNTYIVKVPEQMIEEKENVDICAISGWIDLTKNPPVKEGEYKIVNVEKIYYSCFEEQVVVPLLQEIKEKKKEKLKEKLFPHLSKPWIGIKAGDRVGVEIPILEELLKEEGFFELWWKKLHGGDYRQNIGPTIVTVWVKKGARAKVPVIETKIGKLIGKGGKNIKRICKEHRVALNLFPVEYAVDAINTKI